MSLTAMKLSKAINALCAARGKTSCAQFYQLMHEHDDDERIPSVRLSLLNVSEVGHILCLEPAKNNQGLNSFLLSPCLIKNLAMADGALRNEISAEASMRWRMNNFLLFAFNIATDSRSEESRLLEIHHEPKWSFGPVRYKDQAVKLSGYPSYALWYGDEDEAAPNVVVAQSFIYHHRKNANKENCPVYGVATDSRMFHFVRLDNDSTFVTTTLDSQVDIEKAFSLLVYVLKEAMIFQSAISPPT
ncbi:hypothetical protein N7517_005926 [Penicillium concentricum]|uniref:Uncharacterized protein n=1 Tax=Penicillium concentricum TaxID=293559 RepID=A0A9W9S9I2_9EURO|nr:uncharacterized protein N7517_005926 [Penicillium concentricum]KAJ5373920.1 hypothetical protein N7517_005926 [Penicillium concentricum]